RTECDLHLRRVGVRPPITRRDGPAEKAEREGHDAHEHRSSLALNLTLSVLLEYHDANGGTDGRADGCANVLPAGPDAALEARHRRAWHDQRLLPLPEGPIQFEEAAFRAADEKRGLVRSDHRADDRLPRHRRCVNTDAGANHDWR